VPMSIRSTRSVTMRACSAGNSSSHNGSSVRGRLPLTFGGDYPTSLSARRGAAINSYPAGRRDRRSEWRARRALTGNLLKKIYGAMLSCMRHFCPLFVVRREIGAIRIRPETAPTGSLGNRSVSGGTRPRWGSGADMIGWQGAATG
jgi:hypothetical protein